MKMSWSLFVELIFWARRSSFVKSNSQRQQTPNPLAQVPDLTPPCLRQSCKDFKISSLSSPPQPSTSASFKLGCSKKQNIKSGKAKLFFVVAANLQQQDVTWKPKLRRITFAEKQVPLFPESEAQASFLKETMVKRERTGGKKSAPAFLNIQLTSFRLVWVIRDTGIRWNAR